MSVVDEIKQKLDIVELVSESVKLRRSGKHYIGFCPFHPNTRTPSFVVFSDTNSWHCFGACSTGGDIFTFVMKKENIDFSEALRRLAQRAGVELHAASFDDDARRKKLLDIVAAAASHYHYLLKNDARADFARQYLAKRHVLPETIALFQLGFAPNEWNTTRDYLVGKGYALSDLEAAGVVTQGERGSYYDRFRGRLMFPIRNRTGAVIGFGARALSEADQPKYLNSPQGALFDKSSVLYGLDMAHAAIHAANLAVIVEGYMDVLGAHQAGFTNVVASLGTALTAKQLGLLKKLTKRYALALDADTAGQAATERGLQVAREALERKIVPVPMGPGLIGFEERLEAELLVVEMPTGQDPDEIIYANPEQWRQLVQNAVPLVDYYFAALTRDLDLNSPRGKSTAVKRLAPIVREIRDSVQRAHYTQQLARWVQVDVRVVSEEIARARTEPDKETPRAEPIQPARARPPSANVEEHLLACLWRVPVFFERVSFLEPEDFASAEARAWFERLRAGSTAEVETGRAGLEPLLVEFSERVSARARELPELPEPALAREVEMAAHHLRLRRVRAQLAQIEVLLQDPAAGEERAAWMRQVDWLKKQMHASQKALQAKSSTSA